MGEVRAHVKGDFQEFLTTLLQQTVVIGSTFVLIPYYPLVTQEAPSVLSSKYKQYSNSPPSVVVRVVDVVVSTVI